MLKIKCFFFALIGALILSATSEARVCFLGGEGEENCLTVPLFESQVCPGHATCEIPKQGAKSCIDGDSEYYMPEDCCSDSSMFEPCNGEGQVCASGARHCGGYDANGALYEACERGRCQCSPEYQYECSPADGWEGVGTPCNGKYKSCQCGTGFYSCSEYSDTSGAELSCTDDRGELFTSCSCPIPDGTNWVYDKEQCCGTSKECVNQPSGIKVYKCESTQAPSCTCGYTYNTDKGHCLNGCTDSQYDYSTGKFPANATCEDWIWGLKSGDVCANKCHCKEAYWDYWSTCVVQPTDICKSLGYTDSSCAAGKDWVACPYDVNAKKCFK